MKKYLMILLGVMFAIGTSQMVFAGEHAGSEHGGENHTEEHGGEAKKALIEHGGTEAKGSTAEHGSADVVSAPTNEDIRNAMTAYVTEQSAASGTFNVKDPDTGENVSLTLVNVHERVGRTGDYYYSCADFTNANTGDLYDLDLDVADNGGTLSVVEVRIHKVGGEARYTYDDDDNRIALTDTESHLGAIEILEGISK